MKPYAYLIVLQLLVMMALVSFALTGHQDVLDQLRTLLAS